MQKRGQKGNIRDLKMDIIKRDQTDRERKLSPLSITSDSIILDTSSLSQDEVFKLALNSMELFK